MDQMTKTLERFDERSDTRDWICVILIVFIGSSLGCLFVLIREVLGMKM